MKKNKKKIVKNVVEKPVHTTTISGCEFAAVKWDKDSAVLEIVARALLNFTELFKATNVNIDTMVTVGEKNTTIKDSSFSK